MVGVSISRNEIDHKDHSVLNWVDLIKAIALLWILINHIVERLFKFAYIENPMADWGTLADRIAQLRPLEGYGIWTVPVNLLRYVGFAGDGGVQLFIILSGFGLTWGLLNRYGNAPFPLVQFYRRRFGRIYPLWWGAHLIFILTWLLTGWGLPLKPETLLSFLGIRVTLDLFYYFSPAWWFISLLLQLYLVYPLLWRGLQRWGPLRLLLVSCAIAFVARAVGLLLLGGYVDAWQRGAIFITRLPEFAFGISLAAWLYRSPDLTDRRLCAPVTLLLAVVAYVVGLALALTLLGMAVAPFLLGVSAFVLLYAALGGINRAASPRTGVWKWVGKHSYSLFLLHHPLVLLFVSDRKGSVRAIAGTVVAVVLTVIGAIFLERLVEWITAGLNRQYKKAGVPGVLLKSGAVFAGIFGLLLIGELVVRQAVPQEALGWGERSSLAVEPVIGWKLKPSQETRLRWESYDYRVTANALGFPGPQYPEQKSPGTVRILTTGDAFTSAEGVDTNQSWARLLEADLAAQLPGRKVEVLNFGITGYGPNQYAAIIQEFAPRYKPDLIVVESFVNDYQDAITSNDEFRGSIGFGLPPQNGWYSIVTLSNLQTFLSLHVAAPVRSLLLHSPSPLAYSWGNFAALERDKPDFQATARGIFAERFKQIQTVADQVGAKVVIPMVPASVQVCQPDQLPYYPKSINLSDSTKFDVDLPQRTTQEIASGLGLRAYDLRPVLRSPSKCLYQPHNMHWLPEGHQAVATYLSQALLADGYVKKL